MAGKELTFKLVMNADTRNFTQNLQQGSDAARAMFDRIRQESERARQSVQMGREVGELVQQFHNATTELNRVSDASQLSADNLRQMGEYGQQAISQLQTKLVDARLELNRLSATNATPQDIERARQRVQELETGIRQTTTAVDAYQNAAREALGTSPIPTRFQQDVGNLVNQLDSVRQGIDANGDSATRTRAELEQMSRNATTQLQGYESALEDARLNLNRLSATNATPQDIERARQRVQELETGVDQVRTALNGYQNAARIANNEVAEGSGRVSSAVNGVGGAWNKVAGIAAALGIGISVAELAKIADNFQNISAQIRLVSDSSEEFHSALEGVRVIATQTTTSLESTANLYARISQAGKDLGVTQEQALEVTRAINQSIQISGGSAASADAAITQMIQALQSGVLRGEEFNSMMEQAPRLTTALADSLGVTKGELRAMAGEGKISSEVLINAIREQSAVIAEEYTKIPTTIAGAIGNVKTNFTMLVGEIDSANAASQGIVQTLLYLSDNLDVLMTLFNDVTQGVAYFSDRLNSADPSTIDAVKNAVVAAYDAIKTLISTVVEVGDVINDVFYTGLDVLFGWSGVISGDATESVNGLAVVINVVSVAIGALSDGVKAIGIGFKGLVGLMYDLAAAATYYAKVFTWGDVRAKLDADYKILTEQRDKYYAEAKKDLEGFNSEVVKAIDESTLNAEQANQKKIASNKETLATILADEAKANKDAEANSKRRTELDAQLAKARAENNDEVTRQIVERIKKLDNFEDEAAKSNIKRNKDKLKAGEALATALMAANQGILTDLAKEDLLRDGIIAKINEQGNLEVSTYEDTAKLNTDRLAKIQELSLEQDGLISKRVSSESEAGQAIVQNDADVAAMRVQLNKQALDAKQADDFEAFSKAQIALDNLGKADAQANQQRTDQHKQANDAIHQIDAASFSDFKANTDEQVRLSGIAEKAKQANDFETFASAKLQMDGLTSAQEQANNQLNQSDLSNLEKKEEITRKKVELAQQIIDSTDGVITAEQKLQFEAQGLTIEYDKMGKAVVQKVTTFSDAAKALGVNVSQALNLVSAEFTKSGDSVDVFVAGLQEMGATGEQAANATYQAWEKWAEQAKSPAEIEAAKAKLLEFEKQGVFSAKQVEMGMRYLDEVNGKLPANISEVEKAYKLLGITSREEANKMAAAQMRAFDVMQKSGTASTEQMKKALINMADKIYASGDAAKIAAYESKLAYYGLSSEIDSTGKASVKAMDEWTKSNDRVRDSAHGIGDGYRNAGNIAREEAKSAEQAWADAVDAASAQFDAEMKRQGQSLSKGIYNYNSYSKADVVSQLKSKGYDDKEAEKLAGTIWSKAMEADRDAKAEGMGKGGNPALNRLIEQEFNNAASKGLTTQHGTNKINDLLRQMSSNNLVSTGSTSKAPAVDVNSLAPQVSAPVPSTTATPTSRTVQNNISINGKTISIPVAEENQGNFNDFLSELEMLKKGM
ncbi:tape measure protein [Acinetobacter bohemicus]|uniref:Tape measure domain-containing protein n=1 Tax=Acinetobacter bohemicus TaxID=1435036 RepID=A0A1I6W0H1_9GAMM|nr:tape measure protein [Acinetobacter bohemicus]KAB0650730.1 tape measure protein [Acinetobacter bohemicus]SFT19445.1 tape measure domain-containing protein [Acinetobacter bohemicus]